MPLVRSPGLPQQVRRITFAEVRTAARHYGLVCKDPYVPRMCLAMPWEQQLHKTVHCLLVHILQDS